MLAFYESVENQIANNKPPYLSGHPDSVSYGMRYDPPTDMDRTGIDQSIVDRATALGLIDKDAHYYPKKRRHPRSPKPRWLVLDLGCIKMLFKKDCRKHHTVIPPWRGHGTKNLKFEKKYDSWQLIKQFPGTYGTSAALDWGRDNEKEARIKTQIAVLNGAVIAAEFVPFVGIVSCVAQRKWRELPLEIAAEALPLVGDALKLAAKGAVAVAAVEGVRRGAKLITKVRGWRKAESVMHFTKMKIGAMIARQKLKRDLRRAPKMGFDCVAGRCDPEILSPEQLDVLADMARKSNDDLIAAAKKSNPDLDDAGAAQVADSFRVLFNPEIRDITKILEACKHPARAYPEVVPIADPKEAKRLIDAVTGGDVPLGRPFLIDPQHVRFTQDTASHITSDGKHLIADTVRDLKSGAVQPHRIDPIQLFIDTEGRIWSHSNRRLAAAMLAGVPVNAQIWSAKKVQSQACRHLSSTREGLAITIQHKGSGVEVGDVINPTAK
jgi:hypothetical protein